MSVISKYKIGWPLVSMIGGVLIGLLLLYFFRMFTNTYATFWLAVILGPLLIFIAGNTKLLLMGFLTACLPITVDFVVGDTGHVSGAAGYMISLFDIFLAILYFFWIVETIQKKRLNIRFFPIISIPAFLLIGISAVSMYYARWPQLSWFELIEVLKMYLAFLYIANNIKNERELRFVIAFLILGLLLEGVIGVLQHRYSDPFWPTALGGPSRIDRRISGTWRSFNDFAWYLTFVLPIALSLLFSHVKYSYRFGCGIIFVLGGGSLLWSNSRGGWISFSVAAIFVVVYAFSKIKGKWGLVKTVISIMTIFFLMAPLYPRMTNKLIERFGGEDKGSAESRIPQFIVAMRVIESNPIVGIGLNNYTEIVGEYDNTEEGLDSITSHAVHNIFLHIAAETGVFGLIFFLCFMAVIFFEGFRLGKVRNAFESYAVIGLLGGLLAFLSHGMVDTASLGSKLYMFVWFFAGIIFGIKKYSTIDVLQ